MSSHAEPKRGPNQLKRIETSKNGYKRPNFFPSGRWGETTPNFCSSISSTQKTPRKSVWHVQANSGSTRRIAVWLSLVALQTPFPVSPFQSCLFPPKDLLWRISQVFGRRLAGSRETLQEPLISGTNPWARWMGLG